MSNVSRPRSIAYVPALDGLRALCVIGVLCFHAGLDWAPGGFLGVSTFFTLSGYLLTTLLFAGLDRRGEAEGIASPRVGLLDFWRRRLRRLLPAAVVTLVLVVAAAPALMGPEAQARLGADVVASLLYLVNWRFVQADYAYALIFSDPSLLQHYWSLAIEGQLYVVLPLILVIALRSKNPRRGFGAMVGVLIGVGVLAAFVLGADPAWHDRIYYGTDTRAPEFLVGVLLALGLRTHRGKAERGPSRMADFVAWIALALLLVAFALVPLASDVLHRGGFAAFAVLSALVIAACVRGRSVARLLEWRPLVWIGEVSYGVYLFHWPIFFALDAWIGEPSPWLRLVVGGGLTFALAGASHAWLETPIRRGRGLAGRAPLRAAALATAVVCAFVWIRLPGDAVLGELRGASAEQAMEWPADVPMRIPRVAVFGGSVAFSFNRSFASWIHRSGQAWWVQGWSAIGCGLLMPDFLRSLVEAGEDVRIWTRSRPDGFYTRAACAEGPEVIRESVETNDPDLVVSVPSVWDLLGLPAETDHIPERVGHPRIDAKLRRLMDERVEIFSSRGATVAWLTLPIFKRAPALAMTQEAADVARVRYNELIRELPARHPGRVEVVDLAGYVERWPDGAFDPALREDGLHFTLEGGTWMLDAGLGAELLGHAHQGMLRREVERSKGTRGSGP